MIPTTPVLRVLFVEPSGRDMQLVGEILLETTTRLPGSYVFDVVASNLNALERVSRSDYRMVCVAEDTKSALQGRMAAKLLRRSCPDLSVTLVLDSDSKNSPLPKATAKTGAKIKRMPPSPSSSRSESPSSSSGSGHFRNSSILRKGSGSTNSSSGSSKGCGSGACWGPRPNRGGRGGGFGGGGFAGGFWSDRGLMVGGSSGGDVESQGGAVGAGREGATRRRREEGKAEGPGGGGGGEGGSPLMSSPSSSPRGLTSSLETDLKVVDYVLKRPFSDETFRLLLEATEADHRRVPGTLEEAEHTALLASPSLASALLGDHDDDEREEEGRWNASAGAPWEGLPATRAKTSAAGRRHGGGGSGGGSSSNPDTLELDPGWWLSHRSTQEEARGEMFLQAAETTSGVADGPRLPDSPEPALLPPPPERPVSPKDAADQEGEQQPRRRQRRRPRPREEPQQPGRQQQQQHHQQRGHDKPQQPRPQHQHHHPPQLPPPPPPPPPQQQQQPSFYGPVAPPPAAQFPGNAAFAAAARAGLHPGVPMMLRNHNFPLPDPHCQTPFGVYPSAQQFALSMQGMVAAGPPQQLRDRYPVFPRMQQHLPLYHGHFSHHHHHHHHPHYSDHRQGDRAAERPAQAGASGSTNPGFVSSNPPPISAARHWPQQPPPPYPPPGASTPPRPGSTQPTPTTSTVRAAASTAAAAAAAAAAERAPTVPPAAPAAPTAPTAGAPEVPPGKRARVEGPASASATPPMLADATSRPETLNPSEGLAIGRDGVTVAQAAAVAGAASMGAGTALGSVPMIATVAVAAVAAGGTGVLASSATAASLAETPASSKHEEPCNLDSDTKTASLSSFAPSIARSSGAPPIAKHVRGFGTTLGSQGGADFEAGHGSGSPTLLPASSRDVGASDNEEEQEQAATLPPASASSKAPDERVPPARAPSTTENNDGGGGGSASGGGGSGGTTETAFQPLRLPLSPARRVGVAGGRERGAAALLPLSQPLSPPPQQQQQQRGAGGEGRQTVGAAVYAAAEIAVLTGSPGMLGFGQENGNSASPTAMRSNLQDHPLAAASGCDATVVRLPSTTPDRRTV